MEKKYYDLIISLIKEHRKFQGYEPILDEIAKDVYEHSRVVLGSVINDDVIKSYINKVIAVSIITVSKKLGYRSKERHTYVPNIERAKSFTETSLNQEADSEPVIETFAKTELSTEPAEELQLQTETIIEQSEVVVPDNNENDIEEICIEPVKNSQQELTFEEESINEIEKEELPLSDTEDTLEYEDNEELIDSDTNEEFISLENSAIEEEEEVSETIEEIVEAPQIEEIETPIVFEQTNDVNITFVDNMINGVTPSDTETNIVETCNSFDTDIQDEILEETSEVSVIEEIVENIDDEQSLLVESDSQEEILLTSEIEEEAVVIEDTEDPEVSEFEFLPEEEPSITPFEEEETVLTLDNNEDLSLDNTISIENSENLISFELNETEDIETAQSEPNIGTEYQAPCYDSFSFEAEETEIDENEICKDLLELDRKNPEKQILKVCKLKYTERKSIIEISEELSLTKDDVLETLDQIISTVKE